MITTRTLSSAIVMALVIELSSAQGQTAKVIGLGSLHEDPPGSYAFDVSADGRIVIGESATDVPHNWDAIYWSEDLRMFSLGIGTQFGNGCSGDGRVLVGGAGNRAFYWTFEEGLVNIGSLGSGYSATARDVNIDGSVIVGQSGSSRARNIEAFRWTPEGGMVGLGGLNPDRIYSIAFGVSADGSIVVGRSNGVVRDGAFRWTAEDGMTELLIPDDWSNSYARGISPDGSIIVGRANPPLPYIYASPAYWTTDGEVHQLDVLDQSHYNGDAQSASANGWVIVGHCDLSQSGHAVAWTEKRGVVDLNIQLAELGVNLDEWRFLGHAYGISYDGKTIVGDGIRYATNSIEAYWARVPCIDDCDQCSFTEHMKARCRADGEGTVSVTARLSGAKPGATLTFCLDYWKAFATTTVKENGRAKVTFDHAPPARSHHVTLKECDAPAEGKCRS